MHKNPWVNIVIGVAKNICRAYWIRHFNIFLHRSASAWKQSEAESKRWCNFLTNALGHDSTLKILRACRSWVRLFFCEQFCCCSCFGLQSSVSIRTSSSVHHTRIKRYKLLLGRLWMDVCIPFSRLFSANVRMFLLLCRVMLCGVSFYFLIETSLKEIIGPEGRL